MVDVVAPAENWQRYKVHFLIWQINIHARCNDPKIQNYVEWSASLNKADIDLHVAICKTVATLPVNGSEQRERILNRTVTHTDILAITFNSKTLNTVKLTDGDGVRGGVKEKSLTWDCIDKSAAALWRLTGYDAPSLSISTLWILSHTSTQDPGAHIPLLALTLVPRLHSACEVKASVPTIPVQTPSSTETHSCCPVRLPLTVMVIWLSAARLASQSLPFKHQFLSQKTLTSTYSTKRLMLSKSCRCGHSQHSHSDNHVSQTSLAQCWQQCAHKQLRHARSTSQPLHWTPATMQMLPRELEHPPVKPGWSKAYHHFKEVDRNLAWSMTLQHAWQQHN